MDISEKDKRILRELGEKVADIASLPVNKTRKDLWRRLNGLEKVKPLVCIFSLKPNPVFLAGDTWNPEQVRTDLKTKLAKTGDCVVEVVLKDISTVRHEPQRLWEWAEVATEVTREFE